MGRDRYIPWSRMKSAGNAVFEFLGTATKHHEKGNFMSAIYICEAVAEEMVKAFNFADDSDGDIGGNIEAAFDILWKISSEDIPEEVRVYLMEQCINHYKKGTFNGWDWQFTLIEIASNVAKSEKEAEKIFNLLELQGISEYDMEQVVKIQYGLIKKMKGGMEAEKFMDQNLDIPDLRRKAVDKAMKDKKFDKAISLARDGIDLDLKEKPGLAMEWYDWLLRIALVQKDKSKIIEYARFLFIDGFRHDQDYYGILKKQVDQGDWTKYVEKLIADLSAKNNWSKKGVIANIYIIEQWWEKLLKLISEAPSLHIVQQYEKYLSDKYPSELSTLYEIGVIDFLKRSSDRGHYKEACRIMRKMIKLGARDKVNSLIEKFRKEYPKRIALMDELEDV